MSNVKTNKKAENIKGGRNMKLSKRMSKINTVEGVTEYFGLSHEEAQELKTIRTNNDLLKFNKLVVDPQRAAQVQFTIRDKGESFFSILEKSEGNQVSIYSTFEDLEVLTPIGLQKAINSTEVKGTYTFETINFGKDTIGKEVNDVSLLDELRQHGYYANPSKGKAYLIKKDFINKECYLVEDLCCNAYTTEEKKKETTWRCTEEEKKELLKGFNHYIPFTSTNSEMKKVAMSALNLDQLGDDYLLNEMTFGALNKAKEKYENGELKLTMEDLAKGYTRPGQQKSPSGRVKSLLNKFGYVILLNPIIMFDWLENSYEGKPGYDGSNIYDGSAFIREDYVSLILSIKLISKGLKVTIDPKAARGMQIQCRIWTFKGTELTKRYNIFQRLLENIDDEYKEGEDYIIVGNPDNIVSIMDTDTVKTVFKEMPDFNKYIDADLSVMALAKPSRPKTSKFQMLNKLVGCPNVDKEQLGQIVAGLSEDSICNKLKSIIGSDESLETIISYDTINTGYSADVISELTGGRALITDLALLSKTAKNLDNSLKNSVDKISLDIDDKSSYAMLAHDSTASIIRPKYRKDVLGEDMLGLIGYKEVYSKDWNNRVIKSYKNEKMNDFKASLKDILDLGVISEEQYKTTIKNHRRKLNEEVKSLPNKCFMIKFPAPGLNEVYKARLITDEEIKERALKLAKKIAKFDKKLNIEKEARMLAENIIDTTPGTIIMPALEPLKDFLAGFDDDGDAAALCWHEELSELFLKVEDVMVSIDTKDMGDAKNAVVRKREDASDSLLEQIRQA